MGVIDILLIIFGLLNLIFAGYLFFYSDKTLSAAFYSLISVFASLWSVSTLLITTHTIPHNIFFAAINGHYIFGYLAYLSFFWFSVFYPFPIKKIIIPGAIMSGISFLFLPLIPFTKNFFISVNQNESLRSSIEFNQIGYLVFFAILATVFFSGLFVLLWKLRQSYKNPLYKDTNPKQIYYAILANLAAGSLGIVLNLILPLNKNFTFFSISPVFVIVALLGVGLVNLIKFKLFNARVILAEFFTVGIGIMFLARLLVSSGETELQINSIFFAGAISLGVFLIRSIRAEVQVLANEEKLAHDLEESNKRLHDLDQQKNEFLSFASHQLRTPLTAIKWSAGAMLDGMFGEMRPELAEPVRTIFEESSLMAVFINDYLNVSRIEQGRMEYRYVPTNLVEVLKTTASQMGPAVHEKGLTLVVTPSVDTCMVWGDASKLTQVISNLIDNSVKYTEKGTITISLVPHAVEGIVRIEIKDTGIGMDHETLSKVFDKFARGENAREVNSAGSGLGLFIVKTFVDAHKGKIWIESEGLGKGSMFVIEFPLFVS